MNAECYYLSHNEEIAREIKTFSTSPHPRKNSKQILNIGSVDLPEAIQFGIAHLSLSDRFGLVAPHQYRVVVEQALMFPRTNLNQLSRPQ